MKRAPVPLLALLLPFYALAQEAAKPDPLVGHYTFGNSIELVHFTTSATPRLHLRHALHDLRPEGMVLGPTWNTIADTLALTAGRIVDYVAADIDADGKDELVIARVGTGDSLSVMVCRPTKVMEYWYEWSTPPAITPVEGRTTQPVRLTAANLDEYPGKEVVLHYFDSTEFNWVIFDSVDPTTHRLVGTHRGNYWGNSLFRYDVAPGDIDGDGLDEIILVTHAYTDTAANARDVAFMLMEYDPSMYDGWNYLTNTVFNANSLPSALRARMKVTAGDFRNVGHDEIVLSATEMNGNTGRQIFCLFRYDPGLKWMTTTFPVTLSYPAGAAFGAGWESNAVAADLNPLKNDGDELVVAGPQEVAVLKFNASYLPYYLTRTPFREAGFLEPFERRKFLCAEDINADTLAASWAPEIIVAEHAASDSMTLFRVLETTRNAQDSITGLHELFYGSPGVLYSKTSNMVVGDFDGDAIRAGVPKYVAKNAFTQPIVTLNIPPTHFDTLDGLVYDICQAYPTGGSPFRVKYTQTQSQTSKFSTETDKSWGVSGQVGASGTIYGAKIKASIGVAYGEGTYGGKSFDTTTTVSEELTASADDWTLATVADYDIWEYPLYVKGNHYGDALVQVPHFTTTKWLPGKDLSALNWLADHEVGNLLSYPTSLSYQSVAGSDLLASFSTMTVAIGGQMEWLLDLSTSSADDSKFTKHLGVDVSASISGWGMEAKVDGEYDKTEINTHTSTATKYVTITVNVGPPDASIPNASYTVRPFIYWGENGSLTVDYAVDLDPGPAGLETFWGLHYSAQPDPAFILPWRLDAEKGLGLNPEQKLYNKSLRVSPSTPAPGDAVWITARVHNFSLKDTDGPVTVRFYLGKPDSGGVPIVGSGGQSDISTPGPIPARGSRLVQTEWTAPSGLGNAARLYAVIDPDHAQAEIHEDNNVGYVFIRQAGPTGVEEDLQRIPESFALRQNYPNPFNPSTVIVYDLPRREQVTLTVFDLLGRAVATLVDGVEDAGRHHAIFRGENLASGMYIYRLQAGSLSATRKMVMVR